jgi:rhodanese-related sulfurtransferase
MTAGKSERGNGKILLYSVIFGAIAGLVSAFILMNVYTPHKSQEELIAEFYEVENAVHVSPHGIRKHMADPYPSFILVDLRSQEEYETEHVVGSVSIPAYATPDKSDYGAVDRIVNSFKELEAENPDKEIIVYCYSTPCMTGRKVGKMLTEHDIYVKHLGIGWNEWRYYWGKWNHDGETGVDPSSFVVSGPEPGKLEGDFVGKGCPIEGGFGC